MLLRGVGQAVERRFQMSGPVRMSTIQRTKRKTSRFRWTPEQFEKAAEDGWFGL
jgi:hypothetical protein